MLTVEHYGRIRRAHRDGLSIRAIARTFHHSRGKIREALANPQPRPYTRRKLPPAPVLGPFKPIIDEILAADEQASRKQRHTAMQIFRRLRDEHGYGGGYDQVRRHVAKQRRRQRETFIPLSHDPGQRLECDFGHIQVDFPEGRKKVAVLIAAWSYSNCPFAIALPTERTEAILAGMVQAFEFFGCVPREVWWDNPTTVAVQIFKGRDRQLNERYAALASHYAFEPLACMVARANEKPYAENRVYDLQRRWATPVPTAKDLTELNAYLRQCCLKDRQRRVGSNTETSDQRFERDRAQATPPAQRVRPASPALRAFDPCIHRVAKVDKYQTVRFDSNQYSVPRAHAFRTVTVQAYIDRIEVVAEGQMVARHQRCYERGQQILDPVHYLVTLGRRPAALDHSGARVAGPTGSAGATGNCRPLSQNCGRRWSYGKADPQAPASTSAFCSSWPSIPSSECSGPLNTPIAGGACRPTSSVNTAVGWPNSTRRCASFLWKHKTCPSTCVAFRSHGRT